MMEIALGVMACAVFATLTVVAAGAALKSARVDDIIGEVFSPWIERSPQAADEAKAAAPTAAEARDSTAGAERAGP